MKAVTALRTCILLGWTLVIVGLPVSFWLESKLPIQLQTWLQEEMARDLSTGETWVNILGIVCLVALFVASVGLFRLRWWGAWLYVGCAVMFFPLSFFYGPTVEHAMAYSLNELDIILSGITIGIIFFSDALPKR